MKQRIIESGGQFYPEVKSWLFGWRDARELHPNGHYVICLDIEAAHAALAVHSGAKPNVVWHSDDDDHLFY